MKGYIWLNINKQTDVRKLKLKNTAKIKFACQLARREIYHL